MAPSQASAFAAAALLLAGCASFDQDIAAPAAAPGLKSFVQVFDEPERPTRWRISDYGLETPHQKTNWDEDNVTFGETGVRLSVFSEGDPLAVFQSGEVQRMGRYGHGRFEVVMQPAATPGVASNFFLYSDRLDANGKGSGEISIQFAGRNTKEVRFTYSTDGKRGETLVHSLKSDAAAAPALYAFEHTPEGLRWFVGDELVGETSAGDLAPPSMAGEIIANVWAGREAHYVWLGMPVFQGETSARLTCVSFTAPGEDASACSNLTPQDG